MKKHFWQQLTSQEFKGLDPEKTIAVLPIARLNSMGRICRFQWIQTLPMAWCRRLSRACRMI